MITLHADRPVETATITADGQPPRQASPSYPQAAGARAWPYYELRFYDPLPNGFTVALQLGGRGAPQLYVSDYTVGLEQLPELLRDRPRWIGRPTTAQTSLSLAAPSALTALEQPEFDRSACQSSTWLGW